MLLALHIDLICSTTFKIWSGAFQTRYDNNRCDSANTGRSRRALSIPTQ